MKVLRKVVLVLLFVVLGTGCFVLAEYFLSTTSGEDQNLSDIIGIDSVKNLKSDYFVNENLILEDAKLCLRTEGGSGKKLVALNKANVQNFDTTQAGDFKMTIKYQDFFYELPYSVEYKSMRFAENYTFDFELDEEADFSKYKVEFLDFYGNIQKTTTADTLNISNLDTSCLTENEKRISTLSAYGLKLDFSYSVFYYSVSSNYTGQSQSVDECVFKVVEFLPAINGHLKVAKVIEELNLIEKIYEFNLNRVDTATASTFLTTSAIGKLLFEDKTLILFKDVVGNSTEITIEISKNDVEDLDTLQIMGISKIDNLKSDFFVNELVEFENIELNLLLSDKTTRKIVIDSDNLPEIKVDNVGKFTTQIKFHSFSYVFDYNVSYKAIDFYFGSTSTQDVLVFGVGSSDIFNHKLVCYDFFGNPVGFRLVQDFDVELENFDVSSATSNGQTRTAKVICNGATLEFKYKVV